MEWAISTPPLFQMSILVFLVSTWTAQVTKSLTQKYLEMVAGAGIGHLSCTRWLKMTGFPALINCNWTYPFTASAYRLVSILVSVSCG